MADPKTKTVLLRAEYDDGKGDPDKPNKKAGEKVSLDFKEAMRLIATGMAVEPDSAAAAIVGTAEARTAELIEERTLLEKELEALREKDAADAKTIAELRTETAKLKADLKKAQDA